MIELFDVSIGVISGGDLVDSRVEGKIRKTKLTGKVEADGKTRERREEGGRDLRIFYESIRTAKTSNGLPWRPIESISRTRPAKKE
jgi:hypothetical protein